MNRAYEYLKYVPENILHFSVNVQFHLIGEHMNFTSRIFKVEVCVTCRVATGQGKLDLVDWLCFYNFLYVHHLKFTRMSELLSVL